MDKRYIGHDSQVRGVEEHRLVGGKGDGIRLFEVRNGQGLEFTVSADRCADISRLSFKGVNCGYFSPCGYVAPAYYEKEGNGFLKSFTAGFLTTCGLTAVGAPCVDEGEVLGQHGTVANLPCERISWEEEGDDLVIKALVNDGELFGRMLHLQRELRCSMRENTLTVTDTIENYSHTTTPLMLLYHFNMGYPLLSEKAVVEIASVHVRPNNAHSAEDLATWNKMLPPTPGFVEQGYYHDFKGRGKASIHNPEVGIGLTMTFDPTSLDFFNEWKMMGEREYVLGLEPGNCHTNGRDLMRQEGRLKFLAPGEKRTYQVQIKFEEL